VIVVEDLHSEGGMGFLGEEETDVTEAYNTCSKSVPISNRRSRWVRRR
jgi:hypothetical protein